MSTQIFISWSGSLSHKVASLLHEWIPTVIQSAEPFLSSTDIEKGSRWSDHVAQKLEECGFGIIVLTKDNLAAPWILFEAGALSKMVGRGQVSSILIDVDVVDVKMPLSQFQNTMFSREEVHKLIHSINRASQNPLKDDVLSRTFNAMWPDFESSVNEAIKAMPADITGVLARGPENDIASLKSSVGELIQSVQALRDDVKRETGISNDDLYREIRRSFRHGLAAPEGLISEISEILDDFMSMKKQFGSNVTIEQSILDGWISKLSRSLKFLHIQARRSYPLRRSEAGQVLTDAIE